MKFTNANSFKSKIKEIAKQKGILAQQVQQQYLLEQILKAIADSKYKDSFILKGGYLIGQIIGLDKRTTMDLDVTLKGLSLDTDNLMVVFNEIVSISKSVFLFRVESVESIRENDKYGGVRLKIAAILSRGELSTRPRDRYDVFVLTQLNSELINYDLLSQAIYRTAEKRGTLESIVDWKKTLDKLAKSNYQENLWFNYQKRFLYAKEISFASTNDCLYELLNRTDI